MEVRVLLPEPIQLIVDDFGLSGNPPKQAGETALLGYPLMARDAAVNRSIKVRILVPQPTEPNSNRGLSFGDCPLDRNLTCSVTIRVWPNLVRRLLREQETGGSNPLILTDNIWA